MTEHLSSFDDAKPSPPRPEPGRTWLGGTEPAEPAVVQTLRDVLGDSDQDLVRLPPPVRKPRKRRLALPLALLAATCVSTFFAGATDWQPLAALWESHPNGLLGTLGWRQLVLRNWEHGLTYMGCVLAILMAHEMGHFVATLIYRVPASLPYFIPFPIAPIGTMGAVIGMEGHRANRRGIFDIGLAGPLAGLIVAAPILWWGVRGLDFQAPAYGMGLHCPLLMEWLIAWLRPEHAGVSAVRFTQLNPCFMAGWVGLLITGLNMLPVSQLDGGHVMYALLGRRAHWVARGFLLLAIVFIVRWRVYIWVPMAILVSLLGTDHPPTSDDGVRLGWFRCALGWASLTIPVISFPVWGFAWLVQ